MLQTHQEIQIMEKPVRKFLPQDLEIDSWERIAPYFEDLKTRTLDSVAALEKWMLDRSELDAVLEEDMAWRYIKMNIDTTDEKLAERFGFFVNEISPKVAPYANEFNQKLVNADCLNELDQEKYYIYLRGVKKAIALFREENIAIQTKLTEEQQEYGAITAKMTVTLDGKELTMQQAGTYLKKTDRNLREEAYKKVNKRREEDRDALNTLLDKLIEKRVQIAANAGYDNYRDYMFAAMGRFDYTPQDCFNFHESIKKEITPIMDRFNEERKTQMGVAALKPWDLSVDPNGNDPLQPFDGGEALLDKAIECFRKVRPYYGECLETMKAMGHLDLVSRKGKAPGGFMYPLYESGVPFIYMNAVGLLRDMVTMVHEGGHAVHSFHSHSLELTDFKSTPSEVAELASMSMELISMEHWDVFFDDEKELKRAKREHLESVLEVLPWVATVDKFQHWLYENPKHSAAERHEAWAKIYGELGSRVVDWSGQEKTFDNLWQKQLHIYEVPFYYIEYGMAQLGAIAVWRNYKKNPEKALDAYDAALKLGYTKSIGEIYETAGVRFDFSASYVKELADFVKEELDNL